MAGKYAGGYHGTGDFEFKASTGAEIAANHSYLKSKAAAAGAAASSGGDKKPTPKKAKGKGKGGGAKASPARTTTGPGVPGVGAAPTTGPGLGIVTPNIRTTTGSLTPGLVTTGPGVSGVGGGGSGPGNVGAGGFFGMGTGAPDKVTQIYIGGSKVPRDPLTSDAQEIEDAMGEGELGSPAWFANWAAFGENAKYGWSQTMGPTLGPAVTGRGDTYSAIDWLSDNPKYIGHDTMEDTRRKINDVSWY